MNLCETPFTATCAIAHDCLRGYTLHTDEETTWEKEKNQKPIGHQNQDIQ